MVKKNISLVTNPDDPLWVEKYRPGRVSDCVLPKRIKDNVMGHVKNKCISQHLLFHGKTGTGKTTLAKALCSDIGIDYIVINGSDEGRRIVTLHEQISGFARTHSFKSKSPHKVILIDEADYMNINSIQPALRSFMEEYSGNCKFIFTCNHVGRIMKELQGRMALINFNIKPEEQYKMMASFYESIDKILKNEGITYDENVLKHYIANLFPNFRRMMNMLQSYSIGNTHIDKGILVKSDNEIFKRLITIMKKNPKTNKIDFNDIWEWVNDNTEVDSEIIFRYFFDNIKNDFIDSDSMSTAALITNAYQETAAKVADKDINILAFIIDLATNCELK